VSIFTCCTCQYYSAKPGFGTIGDLPRPRKRLGLKQRPTPGAIMQQASSPVLQQQLRSLHPGALQTLHQSPDGTLYPHNQVSPELQNLHTSDVYQQQYTLSGPPQQPQSHALPVHYEQHALSPQGAYQPFQTACYQVPTLQEHAQQYHASPPQTVQRPIHQLPLPPAVPILTAPNPLPRRVEQELSQQQEGRDGDDTLLSNHGQFLNLKLIPHPPDLDQWRERLFHVDDMTTLTEEQ
jgi:glutathione S-transferase